MYEVLITYPRPYWPDTISAATSENHDTPIEICSPVKMNGRAPGRMTCRNTCDFFAPRQDAARTYDSSIDSTPSMVLSAVAKNAARNARYTTADSVAMNITIASGTQARIGIGRSSSNTGNTYSLNLRDQPRKSPNGTPSAVARKNACATRQTDIPMC